MKNGRPQAKDIEDVDFLRTVIACGGTGPYKWAVRWQVEARLPSFPEKVVHAKARQMLKRGLIGGCGCGCRGDYHVTEDGQLLLSLYDAVAERLDREAPPPLVAPDAAGVSVPMALLREALDRSVARAREAVRQGLIPASLLPPENARPVLLSTDDPSRLKLVFVPEENN